VINITSFYTYMKTVRDLMRSAAAPKPGPISTGAEKAEQPKPDTRLSVMLNIVCMLFLGLEAGRDSIDGDIACGFLRVGRHSQLGKHWHVVLPEGNIHRGLHCRGNGGWWH
jgi:hypothetical protein